MTSSTPDFAPSGADDSGPGEPPDKAVPPESPGEYKSPASWLKVLLGIVGLVITIAVIGTLFQAMTIYDVPKLLQAVLATAGGVLGAGLLFYFLNMFVEGLPGGASQRLMPYAFIFPAMGLLGVFLVYPTVQTINYSFANDDSTEYVGFSNYTDVLGDPTFREAIFNNLLWLLIVPAATVFIGLIVAVLADKLSDRWEKVSKGVIFLPMAISFVGASTIWQFIYAYDPPQRAQTGILNAFYLWVTDLVGIAAEPISWIQWADFSINDILLMVILVWLQAGFAMVLLSSAVKGVPEETLEAARIDGASEFQIFLQVVVPQIRGTMITVFITVLIMVLKVFDIIYVMTGGNYGTNVVAVKFFQQIFQNAENGLASAIVVILLIAVIPVLVYQVRHFKQEEATR